MSGSDGLTLHDNIWDWHHSLTQEPPNAACSLHRVPSWAVMCKSRLSSGQVKWEQKCNFTSAVSPPWNWHMWLTVKCSIFTCIFEIWRVIPRQMGRQIDRKWNKTKHNYRADTVSPNTPAGDILVTQIGPCVCLSERLPHNNFIKADFHPCIAVEKEPKVNQVNMTCTITEAESWMLKALKNKILTTHHSTNHKKQ